MSEDGEISPKSGNADDEDDSFIIDRNHSGIVIPDDETEPKADGEETTSSEWRKNMRKRMFGEAVDPTEEPQSKRRRAALCCFNCRGEHSIAHCPEPKDFAAIRKNKLEFQNGKEQSGNGGRISKVTSEKETKFKPGRLSQALRTALDLGSDDIPEWIYRMRKMGFHRGYPPGYLRKCLKHDFGTLKIYSDDQKKKTSEAEDVEARPAPSIQTKDVHFYMGFNKSYGALRDRERGKFQIPPFDTFCEILQEEVTKDHEYAEKGRIREARQRHAELQKQREEQKEDDDDVIIIDREEKTTEIVETQTPVRSKEVTPEPVGRMGESIHQLIGTPIISRRDASGIWIDPTTPSLEAFAVGIIPFEAKEEDAAPRGIFKKIMSTLRGEGDTGDDGETQTNK